MTPATIIDWNALGQVVVFSLVIGVGVTLAFSLAILGVTGFTDTRRDGRRAAAIAFAVLATLALSVCAVAIVLGIIELTSGK